MRVRAQTIFTDVKRTPVSSGKIFGPVLAVTKAKDFDVALALANDSEFALTGPALFAQSR